MNELITSDIIIAGGILILGLIIGALCVSAINIKGQSGCMTGIITTTSEGDLCGLPGAVETDGLGIIKTPRRKTMEQEHKIGDIIYVADKGWSGEIIGITDLLTPGGGRMLTVAGPDKALAIINE